MPANAAPEIEFQFALQPTQVDALLAVAARARRSSTSATASACGSAGRPDDRPDRPDLRHDGKWYVLDYKSNRLPGYDAAATCSASDGAQRVRPAGADLHARPASLAALPPAATATTTHATSAASAICSAAGWTRAAATRPASMRNALRPNWCMRSMRCSACPTEGGSRHEPAARAAPGGVAHAGRCAGQHLAPARSGDARRRAGRAALASLAVAQGHAGFDPRNRGCWSMPTFPGPMPMPGCSSSPHRVSSPRRHRPSEAMPRPLVLEHGLLYLRRYREYERRLALQLCASHRSRCRNRHRTGSPVVRVACSRKRGDGDHQARAAALALRRTLLLVTGGPAPARPPRSRACWCCASRRRVHAGSTPPRIALAAPTGRAADRMAESLRRAVAADGGTRHRPASCSTPCLCAGQHPASPARHHSGLAAFPPRHADNPLPFDIVVVDEASMVDLPLMCKLVEAVAERRATGPARRSDQLPSVEAGDVLAAILAAAAMAIT
jgi:hypothetical protein